MGNIENLLRRQYEGSITADEQSELDRLTHRDQIISAATCRAKAIRLRYRIFVSLASVLLTVGIIFLVRPSVCDTEEESYLIAKTRMMEVPSKIVGIGLVSSATPVQNILIDSNRSVLNKTGSVEKTTITETIVESNAATDVDQPVINESDDVRHNLAISDIEPIVACNTACSPDSVINDIWKFLRT